MRVNPRRVERQPKVEGQPEKGRRSTHEKSRINPARVEGQPKKG